MQRLLREGFRHVNCIVASGDYWIAHNLGRDGLSLEVLAASDYNLAQYYRDQGLTVVELDVTPRHMRLPLTLNNCVGYTKALLGISSRAVTPWQLYKHILALETSHETNPHFAGLRRQADTASGGSSSSTSPYAC